MKIEVRYQSRSGNTKAIAEAIAEELGVVAKSVAEPVRSADLLILGGAVYNYDLDESLKNFIKFLDAQQIKKVAIFGTAGGVKAGLRKTKKLLKAKGIEVLPKRLFIRIGLGHSKKPAPQHLQAAKNFAKSIIS
jgi:flavodoxin